MGSSWPFPPLIFVPSFKFLPNNGSWVGAESSNLSHTVSTLDAGTSSGAYWPLSLGYLVNQRRARLAKETVTHSALSTSGRAVAVCSASFLQENKGQAWSF